LCSFKNSWKLGLKSAAWGDPKAVKDSDVLRYQWPAIGKGWERGLLKFACAQRRQDDIGLFRQVLALPNTTVAIVMGSKDRVIPPNLTRRFVANFQPDEVNLIELEGLGHNAFEEDVDAFLNAVELIVKSSGGPN
jgi:pimeloyl-ACP methyl ester carboxylesterase